MYGHHLKTECSGLTGLFCLFTGLTTNLYELEILDRQCVEFEPNHLVLVNKVEFMDWCRCRNRNCIEYRWPMSNKTIKAESIETIFRC